MILKADTTQDDQVIEAVRTLTQLCQTGVDGHFTGWNWALGYHAMAGWAVFLQKTIVLVRQAKAAKIPLLLKWWLVNFQEPMKQEFGPYDSHKALFDSEFYCKHKEGW